MTERQQFDSAKAMFAFLDREVKNAYTDIPNYKEILGVTLELTNWTDIDRLILDPMNGIGLQNDLTYPDAIRNYAFLNEEFRNWIDGKIGAWEKYSAYWEKKKPFEYHYAPRVHSGIQFVISRLTHDKDTRQALFSIWSKAEDESAQRTQVPCTISYHFVIRDNCLTCFNHYRSVEYSNFGNDVWLSTHLVDYIFSELRKTYSSLAKKRIIYFIDSFHKFV